jgi:hypothetical protein
VEIKHKWAEAWFAAVEEVVGVVAQEHFAVIDTQDN